MRKSKWTTIYGGHHDNKPKFFVRITPEMLELEKLGFPHGIGINIPFDSKEEAGEYADSIDNFFDALNKQLIVDHRNDIIAKFKARRRKGN